MTCGQHPHSAENIISVLAVLIVSVREEAPTAEEPPEAGKDDVSSMKVFLIASAESANRTSNASVNMIISSGGRDRAYDSAASSF
jgi:hypothetical protein